MGPGIELLSYVGQNMSYPSHYGTRNRNIEWCCAKHVYCTDLNCNYPSHYGTRNRVVCHKGYEYFYMDGWADRQTLPTL